jgi:hypothetical protein
MLALSKNTEIHNPKTPNNPEPKNPSLYNGKNTNLLYPNAYTDGRRVFPSEKVVKLFMESNDLAEIFRIRPTPKK